MTSRKRRQRQNAFVCTVGQQQQHQQHNAILWIFLTTFLATRTCCNALSTLSSSLCRDIDVTSESACIRRCTSTDSWKTLYGQVVVGGGGDGVGVFCQCAGFGICSDYKVQKCSSHNVVDLSTCKDWCTTQVQLEQTDFFEYDENSSSTTTSSGNRSTSPNYGVSCSCGGYEFCSDELPDDDNNNNSDTVNDDGYERVDTILELPDQCEEWAVNPGTTLDDCSHACTRGQDDHDDGETIRSVSSSQDLIVTSEIDQTVYRQVSCQCMDGRACESKFEIVNLKETLDCRDIQVQDETSCQLSCYPNGFTSREEQFVYSCACEVEVGQQFALKCTSNLRPSSSAFSFKRYGDWMTLLVGLVMVLAAAGGSGFYLG